MSVKIYIFEFDEFGPECVPERFISHYSIELLLRPLRTLDWQKFQNWNVWEQKYQI